MLCRINEIIIMKYTLFITIQSSSRAEDLIEDQYKCYA